MSRLRFSDPAQGEVQQDVKACLQRLSEIEQVCTGLRRTRSILDEIYRSYNGCGQQRNSTKRSFNEFSSSELNIPNDLIEAFGQEDFNDFLNNSFYSY